MTLDQFLTFMYPVFMVMIPAFGGIILYLLNMVRIKLQSSIDGIKNDSDRKFAQSVLNTAQDLISTAVVSTNQTLVDTIKSQNGSLNSEEIIQAFNTTYNAVYALLSPKIQKDLSTIIPNFDIWVVSNIEYFVNKNRSTPSVVTPQVVTPVVDTPPVVTPVVDTPPVVTPVVDTPPVVTPVVDTPPVDPNSPPETKKGPDMIVVSQLVSELAAQLATK